MDRNEILQDQEWIKELAHELSELSTDDQLAHHPELVTQRNKLVESHALTIQEEIENSYIETVDELMSLEKPFEEWLQSQCPVTREKIQSEFKAASEKILSQSGLEAVTQSIVFEDTEMGTALQLSDETMQELYTLGRNYIEQKQYLPARALFRFLSFLSPTSVDAWIGLGITYLSSDRLPEAHAMFTAAHSFDPQSASALFYLAYCENLMGNSILALEYCTQIETLIGDKLEEKYLLDEVQKLKRHLLGGVK